MLRLEYFCLRKLDETGALKIWRALLAPNTFPQWYWNEFLKITVFAMTFEELNGSIMVWLVSLDPRWRLRTLKRTLNPLLFLFLVVFDKVTLAVAVHLNWPVTYKLSRLSPSFSCATSFAYSTCYVVCMHTAHATLDHTTFDNQRYSIR